MIMIIIICLLKKIIKNKINMRIEGLIKGHKHNIEIIINIKVLK